MPSANRAIELRSWFRFPLSTRSTFNIRIISVPRAEAKSLIVF
jgi:hypothetical protein